eukprot:Blabericola_migrator_1__10498@NODE_594_length_7434_cov_165_100584_g436_i0_p3_GENE_NODE_594_length_7434_cov_165_100584_g436_i0NODE_594_length_7434_cov_165_100584_g436_i0_p3_ORF_typecomplete_len434_score97_64DUF5312/PF17239_2/0_16_NODE_594_length_7434_cov_165_100584_g436_i022013502
MRGVVLKDRYLSPSILIPIAVALSPPQHPSPFVDVDVLGNQPRPSKGSKKRKVRRRVKRMTRRVESETADRFHSTVWMFLKRFADEYRSVLVAQGTAVRGAKYINMTLNIIDTVINKLDDEDIATGEVLKQIIYKHLSRCCSQQYTLMFNKNSAELSRYAPKFKSFIQDFGLTGTSAVSDDVFDALEHESLNRNKAVQDAEAHADIAEYIEDLVENRYKQHSKREKALVALLLGKTASRSRDWEPPSWFSRFEEIKQRSTDAQRCTVGVLKDLYRGLQTLDTAEGSIDVKLIRWIKELILVNLGHALYAKGCRSEFTALCGSNVVTSFIQEAPPATEEFRAYWSKMGGAARQAYREAIEEETRRKYDLMHGGPGHPPLKARYTNVPEEEEDLFVQAAEELNEGRQHYLLNTHTLDGMTGFGDNGMERNLFSYD